MTNQRLISKGFGSKTCNHQKIFKIILIKPLQSLIKPVKIRSQDIDILFNISVQRCSSPNVRNTEQKISYTSFLTYCKFFGLRT